MDSSTSLVPHCAQNDNAVWKAIQNIYYETDFPRPMLAKRGHFCVRSTADARPIRRFDGRAHSDAIANRFAGATRQARATGFVEFKQTVQWRNASNGCGVRQRWRFAVEPKRFFAAKLARNRSDLWRHRSAFGGARSGAAHRRRDANRADNFIGRRCAGDRAL